MTDYKNLKLIASSSPHIRSNENTRSIMLDVIIAMLPALAMSVYVFGFRALMLTLVSGIGSSPFFAPIAIKTLIAKQPLEENEHLINAVKLDKDEYHLLKYYNMMVINRPTTLFLS